MNTILHFSSVNRCSCSMPSLNVHGTKKKVVGFVDQVSPDRYNCLRGTNLQFNQIPIPVKRKHMKDRLATNGTDSTLSVLSIFSETSLGSVSGPSSLA